MDTYFPKSYVNLWFLHVAQVLHVCLDEFIVTQYVNLALQAWKTSEEAISHACFLCIITLISKTVVSKLQIRFILTLCLAVPGAVDVHDSAGGVLQTVLRTSIMPRL